MDPPPKPGGSIRFENMSSNKFIIGLTVIAPSGTSHYVIEKCESGKANWEEASSY